GGLAGRVVEQLLVEGAADPLRHTAVDLPVHDDRVHDPATVVLNDVLEEAHDAGLDVALHNGGVATAREGRVGRRVVATGFEAGVVPLAKHGPPAAPDTASAP